MGHFIQYNTVEGTDNALFAVIYSFHMPLFMFISGYVAQKTIQPVIFSNYFAFLKKKGISLLLPFFAWPLLVNPFFFSPRPVAYHPLDLVIQLVKEPSGGLWFLWFLFFLTLSFSLFLYMSNKLNKTKNIFYDIIMCLPQVGLLLLLRRTSIISYTDSFILYFIFFYLGVFISRFSIFTRFILNTAVFSFAFITFLVLDGWYSFTGPNNLLIKPILSVTAIISLYYIVNTIKWTAFTDKTIRHWGQNSLVIYTTQFSFIYLLSGNFILPALHFVPLFCITLFFSVIVIILCILIFKIVKLCAPLNLLLYGSRKTTD